MEKNDKRGNNRKDFANISFLGKYKNNINISDIEVKLEYNMLEKSLEKLKDLKKKDVKDSLSVEDLKNSISDEIKDLIENIALVHSGFYRYLTYKYVGEHPEKVRQVLENNIKNKKKYDKTIEYLGYSTNLDRNVNFLVSDIMCELAIYHNMCKNPTFRELTQKIVDNTLTNDDIDKCMEYISKIVENWNGDYFNKFNDKLMQNFEFYFNLMLKNPEFVFDNGFLNRERIRNRSKGIFLTPEEEHELDLRDNMPFLKGMKNVKNEKKMVLGDKDEELDNLQIYVKYYFSVATSLNKILEYRELARLANDPKLGMSVVKKETLNAARSEFRHCRRMDVDELASNVITQFVDLFNENGFMKLYNDKESSKNVELGLDFMNINTDDLVEKLKSLKHNNNISNESKIAIVTFFTNRLTKVLLLFLRRNFILEKIGVFDDLKNGNIKDLSEYDISNEKLKEWMVQFDFIKGLSYDFFYKNISLKELFSDSEDETDKKRSEDYRKVMSKFKNDYEFFYNDSFDENINNIEPYVRTIDLFYKFKDGLMSAIIILAMNSNSKSEILNWGYVSENTIKDNDKVLVGFDIKNLNMPLFFHIKRGDLIRIMKGINGKSEIPLYEGNSDIRQFFGKNARSITTAVLYPITSDQRKKFKKVETNNSYVKHMKLIQGHEKMDSKPSNNRWYDIEHDVIIDKKQVDECDNQNR